MQLKKEDLDNLRGLEESLWLTEKRFNRDYMEKVLAPDFFEFGRSGRIYSREDTLNAPLQEINARLPLKNFNAHLITENVVLVTYLSEVGEKETTIANRSSIWVRTSKGWKLRFHQGTRIY